MRNPIRNTFGRSLVDRDNTLVKDSRIIQDKVRKITYAVLFASLLTCGYLLYGAAKATKERTEALSGNIYQRADNYQFFGNK
ncbi:hypothetical protein J4405_00040 [Candidatus Woesearchaeota archaeon]|nr:hypothetical protein [Candidatus Woesearchaeota archaeon]